MSASGFGRNGTTVWCVVVRRCIGVTKSNRRTTQIITLIDTDTDYSLILRTRTKHGATKKKDISVIFDLAIPTPVMPHYGGDSQILLITLDVSEYLKYVSSGVLLI